MKKFLRLAAGLIFALAFVPAFGEETGTLAIDVENLSPKGGVLRLGLYDEARYPDNAADPVAAADIPAKGAHMTVVLRNIPPGDYALQVFQDINGNGRMDFNWIGLPREPFGFSRDARPRFSKPRFSAVKFHVAPGANMQTVHLEDSISIFQ